jgi:hypothetical protein
MNVNGLFDGCMYSYNLHCITGYTPLRIPTHTIGAKCCGMLKVKRLTSQNIPKMGIGAKRSSV